MAINWQSIGDKVVATLITGILIGVFTLVWITKDRVDIIEVKIDGISTMVQSHLDANGSALAKVDDRVDWLYDKADVTDSMVGLLMDHEHEELLPYYEHKSFEGKVVF